MAAEADAAVLLPLVEEEEEEEVGRGIVLARPGEDSGPPADLREGGDI